MVIKHFVIGVAFAASLLFAGLAPAHAAVVDSNANGLALAAPAPLAASHAKVYAVLIHPENWWDSEHTFSQDAKNLSLDAKAGGCLCETLPGGGSVQHLTVASVMPDKTIRFRGAMGPFQGQGVDGALTFTLKASGDGTDLVLDNNVGGFLKGGMGKWPQAADGMLTDLVAHLKYYAENGKPAPVK